MTDQRVRPRFQTMIVIPARLASSRLPEKLLLRVNDKSILQHTYESARRAEIADDMVVAVDDPRLAAEVDRFGGHARLTSVNCQSGTDRIAEIAAQFDEVDVFINVQGDEPEIDPATINAVGQLLIDHPEADMATAACRIRDEVTLKDANCVKLLAGDDGRAITFSRAPIPFARDGLMPAMFTAEPPLFWHHVGIYAYRREFLLWFANQPPGALERTEKLEQLRAIQAGKTIVFAPIEHAARGIDTLADYREFQSRIETRG